jgi:hypothetical protein
VSADDPPEAGGDKGQAPAPRAPREPTTETWVGLLAVGLLVLGFVLPLDGLRRGRAAAEPPTNRGAAPGRADAGSLGIDPRELARSLASAAKALAEVEAIRRETAHEEAPRSERGRHWEPPGPFPTQAPSVLEPPPATAYGSATRCLASYVPELDLAPHALDFVCTSDDLWAIERRVAEKFAYAAGSGAEDWRHLGPYGMGALASMRAGCCPQAVPVRAVVPGLWCGILRDRVRQMSAVPERTSYLDVAETLECLRARGVRLPARWYRSPPERQHAASRAFVERARRRVAPE